MTYLLFLLLIAAWVYQFMALVCLGRFFRPSPSASPVKTGPGITIFKPLKGISPLSRECLTSFLTQDYHSYQVLFGVRDPDDPVLALLRELARAHPGCDLSVVICPEALGLNPKISTLRQLMPRARYDLLVIADGDVKVGPDYLAQVAAAFREPGVGLVSCPYRAGPSHTLGSALEALTIAADFIPSVAVANYVEGIHFALGATMALTRQALSAIGGLGSPGRFPGGRLSVGLPGRPDRAPGQNSPLRGVDPQPGDEVPGLSFAPASLGPHLPDLPPRRVIWPTASPTPWFTASPSS